MDEQQPTPDTVPPAARTAGKLDPAALVIAAICSAGWLLLFVLTCFHS